MLGVNRDLRYHQLVTNYNRPVLHTHHTATEIPKPVVRPGCTPEKFTVAVRCCVGFVTRKLRGIPLVHPPQPKGSSAFALMIESLHQGQVVAGHDIHPSNSCRHRLGGDSA